MTDSTQSPIWRIHPVHSHLEVSESGELRALSYVDRRGNRRTAKPRRVQIDTHGYPVVKIDGKTRKVHHLVLETFIGPCPPGMETLHRDASPGNPALSNLRWGTRPENSQQRVADGNDDQARRTHCPRLHPLSGTNLYTTSAGYRQCRACTSERSWLRNNPTHPDHEQRRTDFEALLIR